MHIASDGFGKRQHEFDTVRITLVGNDLFSYTATMLDSSQELSKAGGVTRVDILGKVNSFCSHIIVKAKA